MRRSHGPRMRRKLPWGYIRGQRSSDWIILLEVAARGQRVQLQEGEEGTMPRVQL